MYQSQENREKWEAHNLQTGETRQNQSNKPTARANPVRRSNETVSNAGENAYSNHLKVRRAILELVTGHFCSSFRRNNVFAIWLRKLQEYALLAELNTAKRAAHIQWLNGTDRARKEQLADNHTPHVSCRLFEIIAHLGKLQPGTVISIGCPNIFH
jgi:hypothetical protein